MNNIFALLKSNASFAQSKQNQQEALLKHMLQKILYMDEITAE